VVLTNKVQYKRKTPQHTYSFINKNVLIRNHLF